MFGVDGEEWEVIDVYSIDDMIEDGFAVEVGKYEGKPVVVTNGVFEEIIKGKMTFEEFMNLKPVKMVLALAYLKGADIYPIKINGREVWLDWNGIAFTFLFPDEY